MPNASDSAKSTESGRARKLLGRSRYSKGDFRQQRISRRPFAKHLNGGLKEFITAVGERALEIANEEQREQRMFLERQERQSKTIAEIAEKGTNT